MTGFGRGRTAVGDVEVVTEVRSVNHRFLDISARVPKMYSCFEPEIRRLISTEVHRGKIDVTITRSGSKGALMEVMLDQGLAESYHRCLNALKEQFGFTSQITVSDMLTLKEIVIAVEKEEGVEHEWKLVHESVTTALNSLNDMRATEGAALWRDIEARLELIRKAAGLIMPLADQVTGLAKERLEKRVAELMGGLDLDKDRLLQEVAIIADRSDITEELTRVESHVGQFVAFGSSGSPLGRKLDFLLQELHREVNTLGTKSGSTAISAHVVEMKAEVEKIREQTQNLE